MKLNQTGIWNQPVQCNYIPGTRWGNKGDEVKRAYGYGYDKVNRLMFGDFGQGSTIMDDAKINFDI